VSDSAAQHRAKQTVRNLIYSLLVTVALVAAIVLGVPRDDSNRIAQVEYSEIAAQATDSLGAEAIAPVIPEDWWSNAARLENELDVQTWYVGFVTADNQFIGMSQTVESNPSWLALTLQGNWQEGEVVIDGKTWEIWPTLNPQSPRGTKHYAMVHKYGDSAVVIYGTAEPEQFELLAKAIGAQLD
jgi:hypothetical protein